MFCKQHQMTECDTCRQEFSKSGPLGFIQANCTEAHTPASHIDIDGYDYCDECMKHGIDPWGEALVALFLVAALTEVGMPFPLMSWKRIKLDMISRMGG